ncbi:MAG: beta-lactamase family protein [Cyclobacteriaceae bacterium]|nr:beta-lactamase family protein [Cyclobacteriaceae bacterium]
MKIFASIRFLLIKNLFQLLFLFSILLFIQACNKPTSNTTTTELTIEEKMLVRADSFELDTPYEPVPGDALSHHASGFAKILCSAVFITGLDFDFAAENIGYFSAPYKERAKFTKRELDTMNQAVHITLPNGVVRTAKYYGDQGCICLPEGKDELFFEPQSITSSLPDPSTQPWPMGDILPDAPFPDGLDMEKVSKAVEAAFENPEGLTAALVITWKGRIIGEHYKDGIDKDTRLESWSMGKSLTATLMGTLIQQGIYTLDQPAPVPEWQEKEGDPRAKIRISDIMHMSSGLRFRAPQDPDFDPELGYPDHLYVYTGAVNSFKWAATRPQQWLPNTIGRYRNSDPVLINYLVRLGVEGVGQDYLSYPQRALFDKIGVQNMTMETDPYGNYLLQGYEFAPARDWARLGNLYLNDGMWMGERILPEGFTNFVSTLATPWEKDGRPIYGGFFWINGNESFPIPKDAYYMAGAGGQLTIIIPSHDLVVVKLSHYKGSRKSGKDLNKALRILMEAVPH